MWVLGHIRGVGGLCEQFRDRTNKIKHAERSSPDVSAFFCFSKPRFSLFSKYALFGVFAAIWLEI